MGKWEMVRLGDVCEVVNGFAFKSNNYTNNGYRVIRITNVQKGKIVDDDPKYYNESPTLYKYSLGSSDLLMSLTGNVGRVGIIQDNMLPAYLNQRVACLRENSAIILKSYLFSCLNSDFFEIAAINSSKGLAQKNMSTEWLKEYPISLPPLPIQQKIADVLYKASALIEKRKAQIEKLDLLVKAQFIEMFGDPLTNPKGWEIGTIRDLVSDVKYGTSKPANDNGKYIYLRMNNITYSGTMDYTSLKYINLDDSEMEKYMVRKGDLLFNRTNSKELVGKTAVFKEDTPMIIAGYIIRVRTNERANSEYISGFLNSSYGKQTLLDMCKSIVGQANINAQELQSIMIPITPIALQNQFANLVQQIDVKKTALQQSLAKLELNYKSLMQSCFRGEVFDND